MKGTLLSASVYNITGGLLILFFLDIIGPFVGFTNTGSMLFRLFVGGTAITFGIGYLNLGRGAEGGSTFLYYGAGLKYWAFIISMYCFLSSDLSLQMLLAFGIPNFAFAVLFTRILVTAGPSQSEA
jgi:hypothetical protein